MTDEKKQGRERYRELNLPSNAVAEFWLERLGDKIETYYSIKSSQGGSSGGAGSWQRCSQHACLGESTVKGMCLAHAEAAFRQEYFKLTAYKKSTLSLKGIVLSQHLWDEITASPIFMEGNAIVPISFVAAEINARIVINERELGYFDFTGASVFAEIRLTKCMFNQGITTRFGVFIGGPLSCPYSTFFNNVDISYSRVERTGFSFERCEFHNQLIADGIVMSLSLRKAKIFQSAFFRHMKGHLILSEAHFLGSIDLNNADCGSLHGEHLDAETANRLGPCKIGSLNLQYSTFKSRIHFDVISDEVNLLGTMLNKGGLIDIQAKSLQLSQMVIGGPLRVSGKNQAPYQAEIHGLLNTDAGQISFARVNLTKCSFYGAHDLKNIDIESTVTLPKSHWWLGRRRFIVDELAWRTGAGWLHSHGWEIDGVHVGTEQPQLKLLRGEQPKILIPALDAAQVAAIYRELRRSLESKSDMPGAADFYYGEMEMRRWSAPPLERGLVWLYWLISGYGMRAWRALMTWFILIGLGTYLMSFDGFETDSYSITRALLFSIRATLPGVATIDQHLNSTGQAIEIGLRILGPLTIALFLIAVRSKLIRKPSD